VLGLGVERGGGLVEHEQQRRVAHEAAGQRQLLPLPEAHVHALRPARAELGVEAAHELLTTSSAPARSTAPFTAAIVVERASRPRRPHGARQLEAEEVLEGAGQARAPRGGIDAARGRRPSTRMRPALGS
jgi:hypothetical protein